MINFSMISSPSQSNHRTFPDQEAEKDKIRFQVELEFVQCLGNPNYLNFLAQRGYFKDPAFINYLKYLQYWSKPDYVKFLKFPVCLHFLELLQHESFRKEIVKGEVWINFIFSYETEKNIFIEASSTLHLIYFLYSAQNFLMTKQYFIGKVTQENVRGRLRQLQTLRLQVLLELRHLNQLNQNSLGFESQRLVSWSQQYWRHWNDYMELQL